MKNPLRYQLTEYDCGPTSMINAVSFLFEREEIPPEILRNITLYCLDCYDADGSFGKSGTSCTAMKFLSNWLNSFGNTGRLPVSCLYLSGEEVRIDGESEIVCALHRGEAVVVRLYFDVDHYVLLTGERDGKILMFDPYYTDKPFEQKDIGIVLDFPKRYNRIVPVRYLDSEENEIYSLGKAESREAVILSDKRKANLTDSTSEIVRLPSLI